MPPLIERIKSYREELAKWEEAGKPYRSKGEIEFIYKEYCEKCEFLTNQMSMTVCDICGCFVNKSLTLNKIALATTYCPKDKWLAKYTEEIKQKKNNSGNSAETKINPPIIGGSNPGACCGN